MMVIMLLGKANCGKTSTLNILHGKLASMNLQLKMTKNIGNPLQHDFEEIIEYKNKTIIIYTMGDYSDKIEKKIAEHKNNINTILICACNDSFQEYIKQLLPDQDAIVLKKTLGTDFISNYDANYMDGLIILRILEEMINKKET